jgi:UDP-N-acetylmuramoylalanine--D-glutamate ligase
MTGRFDGLTVLVAGFGKSGRAALEALTARGAKVVVADDGGAPGAIASRLVDLAGVDLVVASPGWPPHGPLLARAAQAGLPIWSEVELAWRLRANPQAKWLAVTGTNGKTTTVEMLAAMAVAGGRAGLAAGNVGLPLVQAVQDPGVELFAVELSSFQLHFTHTMAPWAAAVTNLAPDHLDWHGSMAAYAAAKARIFDRSGLAVVNADSPEVAGLVAGTGLEPDADPRRVVGFTLGAPQVGQVGVADAMLVDRAFGDRADGDGVGGNRVEARPIAALAGLAGTAPGRLPAPHLVANALAASALALSAGIEPSAIGQALRGFVPGAHRLEPVGQHNGVAYIDDSKATNAHAAAAALAQFDPGQVVWLAGGLAKGATFDQLIQDRVGHLAAAVVIGQDRSQLMGALGRHAPGLPVIEIAGGDTGSVMEQAVRAAAGLARPGQVGLLAPAAASMDPFTDYAARGTAFAQAVAGLGA